VLSNRPFFFLVFNTGATLLLSSNWIFNYMLPDLKTANVRTALRLIETAHGRTARFLLTIGRI